MSKIQINIRLMENDHARLLRQAGEAGMERGAFARDLVIECLDARDEGRATFGRETLGPDDLVTMKAVLGEGLMEIKRIADTWATHEAEVRALERKDQHALHAARAEFAAGLPERIRGSLNPIRAEMAAMATAIANQPRLDAIDDKQAALVVAVRDHGTAIDALRKDPRTVIGIVLGDGRLWSTLFVCQWSLLMAVLGMAGTVAVGVAVPAFGIPLAHKLTSGDAEFCHLIHYRFATDRCQVPAEHRVEPERIGAPHPHRAGRR